MITRDTLTKIFLQQWGKSTDDANLKIFGIREAEWQILAFAFQLLL